MKRLLVLICDLQGGKFKNADIAIFVKPEVRRIDKPLLDMLAQHFDNVHVAKGRRPGTGWPTGPNALAMDVFKRCHQDWKAGNFEYEAAMLLESDCIPLRATWIDEIMAEWRSQDKLILGYWDGGIHDGNSHINGNLVFYPSIIEHVKDLAYGDPPRGGWDVAYWQWLRPHAAPSRLIFSDYRLNTVKNPLRDCEFLWEAKYHRHKDNPLKDLPLYPCWMHGIKGNAGVECVRRKFLRKNQKIS